MSLAELQFIVVAVLLSPVIAGMAWLLARGGGFARELPAVSDAWSSRTEHWVQGTLD